MASTTTRTEPPQAPRRRSSRIGLVLAWTAAAIVLLGVVLVAFVVSELAPDDGERYARNLAERTAIGIADDVEPSFSEPLDAENLAQRAVQHPRLADEWNAEYDIRVLGWEGNSGDADGARIDLAIVVEVPSWSSGAIFGESRTAGSATTCWRFTVHAAESDVADHDVIDCPDKLAAVTPHPTPLPSLKPDAEEVVLHTLDGLPDGASVTDAEQALQKAFPEFVDVRAERSADELVATVGVGRSRDCVVAVLPDGEAAWRFSDFDRIQLEPGELGCDPGLYLRPVTTH